jgi:uncharacterized iron-regulated protein
MNRAFHDRTRIVVLALAAGVAGCSDSTSPDPEPDVDFAPALAGYASNVAVATYADLAAKSEALHAAAVAFAAAPTRGSDLQAVADAWVAARVPWEASEAFLFGPAAFLSLDPSLDSWPVDRQQLDEVLNSSFELTPEFLAEGLGPALRGFHTIEYLVFRDGAARDPGDVTPREAEYLVSATRVLADDAGALHAAWSGGFAGEFAGAGASGSRYLTQRDAVLEILEGMIAICDEVANGKIADPYDEQDPELVESQFSFNSLADFADNMRSVRNAYFGGYHLGADGPGLDELVRARSAELDAQLTAQIQAAIDAIGEIPAPFRNNLGASAQIEAAQAAVIAILNTIESGVKPLLLE